MSEKTTHEHEPAKKEESAKPAQDVTKPIVGFFKSLTNFDLNSVASLAAPTLRRLAVQLADKLKKNLPVNHPLRGDFSEMMIDLIAQQIKKAANGQTPVIRATLNEFGEFIEAFGQEFCGENSHAAAEENIGHSHTSSANGKARADLEKWALEKIQGASEGDCDKTVAEITKKIEAWQKLENLLTHGPKKEEPPAKPHVPLKTQIKAKMDEIAVAVDLKSVNEKLRERIAARKAAGTP